MSLDLRELAEDPRFVDNSERLKNRTPLEESITEKISKYTTAELMNRFFENDVPAEKVNSLSEVSQEWNVDSENYPLQFYSERTKNNEF